MAATTDRLPSGPCCVLFSTRAVKKPAGCSIGLCHLGWPVEIGAARIGTFLYSARVGMHRSRWKNISFHPRETYRRRGNGSGDQRASSICAVYKL